MQVQRGIEFCCRDKKGKEMTTHWIDDEPSVVVLRDMGIEPVNDTIAVHSIDRKASAENRARKVPLDGDRVECIKHAIAKGVPLPKIVVRKTRGAYVIAGGNHRFASLNGDKAIPVHIIECTDAEFEVACRVLNTTVGVGISKDERIEAATDAVERLGMTHAQAAILYGISKTTIGHYVASQRAKRRLREIAPSIANKLTQTHLKHLGDLAKNDNVLRAAAELVARTKLSNSELAEVARVARKGSTEAEQVIAFESELRLRETQKKNVVKRPVRKALLDALTRLHSIDGRTTWESVEVNSGEVPEFKKKVKTVVAILTCLLRADG